MIVTDLPDGDLHLVRQAAHAHTSGQIALAWQRPAFLSETVWEIFIDTVATHDEGWNEADDHPLVNDAGRPVNFKSYPTKEHIAIWLRTLDYAKDIGPYAQLLIAGHARWLYTHLPTPAQGDEAAAVDFIAQLDQKMDTLFKQLRQDEVFASAVTPEHFQLSRKLFSFFDALSLVFVRGLDWMSFTDDLPVGGDVQKMKIHGEMCAIRWGRMTPWPFAEDDVTFSAPMRRIPGRAYADTKDLLETINQTEPVMRYFNLGRL